MAIDNSYTILYTMYMSIIFVITLSLVSSTSALAITNSTSNVGVPLSSQIAELRIDPYFAPDESCDFDAYQLHCIPGEDQDCNDIPGFNTNEDGTCHVDQKCPDGYHGADEDETGQCYPDTEPCYPGQVRNQTDPNDKSCSYEELGDIPDATCLSNPDQEKCNVKQGVGTANQCPDAFVVMHSYNLSSAKCVPEDLDEVERAERERQVMDPNRCAIGYKLQVSEGVDIHQRGNTIGNCDPIN